MGTKEQMVDHDFLIRATGWEKQMDYFIRLQKDFIVSGAKFIAMPIEDYKEAERFIKEKEEKARMMAETARLNNIGVSLEKQGKIDEAILVYEDNIKLGYPAAHSYHRLRVLYCKRKQYADVERVLRRTAEIYKWPSEMLDSSIKRYCKTK